MLKRHKDLLRDVVIPLRRTLVGYTKKDGTEERGDLDRELDRLGIARDGRIKPRDLLTNPTQAQQWARRVAEAELADVAQDKRAQVREELVERAAYSWINRLLALRVMEARGLIDETLRSNPDYDGLSEALYVLRQDSPDRASGTDGGWWAVIEEACRAQAEYLPGLFALDDPSVALRPTTAALLECIGIIGGSALSGFTLDEADATFADPDAIGWAYQFYQEEAKAQIDAKTKRGGKVETRDELAAKTELFTEPYMVKWLLQNSLGRSYHEAYPRSALPDTWHYYIRPERWDAPSFPTLEELSLLDPCMGSGHFLREAFDMLVAMYREQQPELDAADIADRILAHHLHGIDIDPRAAQLAAFTLYIRAWELVRDERRARRQTGPGSYAPPALNLSTTPDRIAPGTLSRHLQRHPGDRPLEPLLVGVFAALENADMLGSLLRPREHLAAAIAELRKPRQLQIQPDPDLQAVQTAIENIVQTNPSRLEEMLLERVAASFATEVGSTDDVASALFGRAVERGTRLLQLLDQRYAIVVTNPPYMGSANMDMLLRGYIERHYPSGKRDLAAAFIICCLDLTQQAGRVAMITPQKWMYQKSYSNLRALETIDVKASAAMFTGILGATCIEAIAPLTRHAFSEVDPPDDPVVFTLRKDAPTPDYSFVSVVIDHGLDAEGQAQQLSARQARFVPTSYSVLLAIEQTPILTNLSPGIQRVIASGRILGGGKDRWITVADGMNTGDNDRFVRYIWEVCGRRWRNYSKGGGYSRWAGFEYFVLDWSSAGDRIRGAGLDGTYLRNTHIAFIPGLCYTRMARGALGVRFTNDCAYDGVGLSIQCSQAVTREFVAQLLNARLTSFLARTIARGFEFRGGYVQRIPKPPRPMVYDTNLVLTAVTLKQHDVSMVPIERSYDVSLGISYSSDQIYLYQAMRHTIEGMLEAQVIGAYELSVEDQAVVDAEVGRAPGLLPLSG